jgi:hypothetical protein
MLGGLMIPSLTDFNLPRKLKSSLLILKKRRRRTFFLIYELPIFYLPFFIYQQAARQVFHEWKRGRMRRRKWWTKSSVALAV